MGFMDLWKRVAVGFIALLLTAVSGTSLAQDTQTQTDESTAEEESFVRPDPDPEVETPREAPVEEGESPDNGLSEITRGVEEAPADIAGQDETQGGENGKGDEAKNDEETTTKSPDEEKKSWTDGIKLKGDFRYRFELIDTDDSDLRYRHRIRARVGIFAEVLDSLDVGIQLGSGSSDDPVSNNQTLTQAFSSKPIWIDLAYVDWHPGALEGFSLVAGKVKNPFYTVGKSELIWDPDLNPEGLAFSYQHAFGIVEPFFHGAGFWVEERKNDKDAWLLGVQGGLKFNFAQGRFYFLAGAGYTDLTHIKGKELLYDPADSLGNSTTVDDNGTPADPDDDILLYANDYNLTQAFAELGGKLGRFPWAVFGDWVMNTGADEGNMGWLVGASFGKCKEALDFALRYIYKYQQSDGVFGLFTDSDFRGGGTDGKGHEANLEFQIAKQVKAAVTYFYNDRPLNNSDAFHRAQFDLSVKF